MSYATVEAAIQTRIRALSDFTSADVTRGDWRRINAGSAPYAVLYQGGFTHEAGGGSALGMAVWETVVEVFARHYGDGTEFTSLAGYTQNIIDDLDKYPTLNGASGVIDSHVVSGDRPVSIFERGSGPDAGPMFLMQVLHIETVEKTVATGGEYPS